MGSLPILTLLFAATSLWALVGCQSLGGYYYGGNPALQDSDLFDANYDVINFNDFPSSLMLFFVMLVTGGPFAHQRNPIYAALIQLMLALGLAYDSGWVLVAAGLTALWLHLVVVPAEEEFMARLVGGDAFADYCAAVPRWSPVPSLLISSLDLLDSS